MVKVKPLSGASGINHYIRVKLTYFKKIILFCILGTSEGDIPPSFHSQPYVYIVTVTGKLRILELYLENYRCFSVMEKEKGLEVLNWVLDEREEFMVDRDRNVYDPVLSVRNVSVSKQRLWQYSL